MHNIKKWFKWSFLVNIESNTYTVFNFMYDISARVGMPGADAPSYKKHMLAFSWIMTKHYTDLCLHSRRLWRVTSTEM